MTLNELTDLLPTLTAGVLAIGLILFLLALRLFRRGRKASLWQSRRQAGKRGFRLMLTAIGFLGLSGMLCVTTIIFSSLDEYEGKTATTDAAATLTTTESVTLSSETPTSTATPTATDLATDTSTATATAEIELTDQATEIATEAPAASSGGENQNTPSPENTAIASASPSLTNTSTVTASPTMTATQTPTLSPTDAPTGTPTITPFPTLPSNITPPVAQATPGENISMRVAAIAEGLTADFQALSPRQNFEAGVPRLYFFIHFRNMNSGILWRPALFKDGVYLDGGAYLWGLQAEGESYFFFGQANGFEAGSYEIRIYIGDEAEPLATEAFTVR